MQQIITYANDSFLYSYNVSLANNQTWSANTHLINLDYMTILGANTANTLQIVDIGYLPTVLSPIITNLPNTINYSLTISANTIQTQELMANSVNPAERVLIMQTKFTSNTANVVVANNVYLKIRNVLI